jgi:methyl-accepting chemotaxis protein
MSVPANSGIPHRRASVSTKILLVIAMFSLPIGVLAYLLAANYTPQIETARLEIGGNAFQKLLMAALQELIETKSLVEGCAAGCSSGLAAATDSLNGTFDTISREGGLRAGGLKTTDSDLATKALGHLSPDNLRAEWKSLAADSKLAAGAEQRVAIAGRYNELMGEIKGLVRYVGDTSTLILDPELDSHYLVDVTLLAMPETMIRIADTFGVANRLPAGGQADVDRAALANESNLLTQNITRIAASNQTTFDADAASHGVSPTLQSKLRPALQKYQRAMAVYLGTLRNLGSNASSVTADALKSQAHDANQASFDYWSIAANELDLLLQKRIDDFKANRIQALGFSALAVLIAAIMAFLIGRSITEPLESLMRNLGPSEALVRRMGERVAAAAQSATPNPEETEIICEELSAQADNMRRAVLELARQIEGTGADRAAPERVGGRF